MEEKKGCHNAILEGRKRLSVSAVTDVCSFNENEVKLTTSMGLLKVEGSSLKVNKLSVETGDVLIEGKINALIYLEKEDE